MSFKEAFLDFLRTGRQRTPEKTPSPYGARGVHDDDAAFILGAQLGGKWGDVQSYGPGQAEAEARRAGLTPKVEAQAPDHPREKHRRRRPSKAERLQRKLERLKADVQKLEHEKNKKRT